MDNSDNLELYRFVKLRPVKVALVVLVAIYFFGYWRTYTDWHFIDSVDLVIHEAGHVVLMPLGDFMHVAGGSIFQVVIPLVFILYFYLRGRALDGSLLMYWLGVNLLNISIYAGDALKMQLPLLGGDGTIHDWNYMLVNAGLLHYTDAISGAIYLAGFAVLVAAAALSIYHAVTDTAPSPQ